LLNSRKCRTSSGSRLGFSSTLIYSSKGDVYLNGGPAHTGAASLPDGSYYVQVTDRSGACILGTSLGSGNETPICCDRWCRQLYKAIEVLINTGRDPTCAGGGVTDLNCGYNGLTCYRRS
jgi:hypothetical protein